MAGPPDKSGNSGLATAFNATPFVPKASAAGGGKPGSRQAPSKLTLSAAPFVPSTGGSPLPGVPCQRPCTVLAGWSRRPAARRCGVHCSVTRRPPPRTGAQAIRRRPRAPSCGRQTNPAPGMPAPPARVRARDLGRPLRQPRQRWRPPMRGPAGCLRQPAALCRGAAAPQQRALEMPTTSMPRPSSACGGGRGPPALPSATRPRSSRGGAMGWARTHGRACADSWGCQVDHRTHPRDTCLALQAVLALAGQGQERGCGLQPRQQRSRCRRTRLP